MHERTILLIQSNPITRDLIVTSLRAAGHRVVCARDSESALQLMETRLPSLVLQDVDLSDGHGLDLVTLLRHNDGADTIPIIALSGVLSSQEEAKVIAQGYDDVLFKPIDPSTLRQRVEAYLPDDRGRLERFGEGYRVVVADDDPVQLKLVLFHLSRLGFEAEGVPNGERALKIAQERVPDAVLTDVMMPKLDGFGLCHAMRKDVRLAAVPVILMTSSYIEDADQALARRTGASCLVLRTPDLRDVVSALRLSLHGGATSAAPSSTEWLPATPAEVERERTHRVIQRLERQVASSSGLARRCARLSAELSVLNSISDALANNQEIDTTLDTVLTMCFDAIGVRYGVLYTLDGDRGLSARTIGVNGESDTGGGAEHFFGHADRLHSWINANETVLLPSSTVSSDVADAILSRSQCRTAMLMPLRGIRGPLGALFLASSRSHHRDEGMAFVKGVINQVSQSLSLAAVFAERTESERHAREHASLLGSVLESIADGVIVLDNHGDAVRWNTSANAIMTELGGSGPRVAAWMARHATSRCQETRPVSTGEATARVLADDPVARALGGHAVDDYELAVPLPEAGDKRRWFSVAARPRKRDDGSIGGAVVVLRDVTIEKYASAQLMVSDRMASVGMLAAGVAHEINNPLTAVVANLDLALDSLQLLVRPTEVPKESPQLAVRLREVLEEVEGARTALDRACRIVQDLKLFSRGDEEESTSVDVVEVLESSLQLAWNEIRHRASVVKDLRGVPPIRANASRLGQVFLNLLINAAQAIPEGQANRNQIRVATRASGPGWATIEFADSGSGMSQDVLSQLFTPFFTTKPVGVGTGLGLSICRRIVSSFDGRIEVESRVGRGSCFRVLLPTTSGVLSKIETGTPTLARAVRRAKILIVDDEEAITRVLQRALSPDHDVVALNDANEALQRILGGEFYDLILCDLMMPVITGMDFYARLLGAAPAQAKCVVFLTGGAFTPQAREFLERTPAARTCIEKPFNVRSVRAFINEHLQ